MSGELPHFVHRKIGRGRREYYYFALEPAEKSKTPRYVRLPDIHDPTFQMKLEEMYRRRPAPAPVAVAMGTRRVWAVNRPLPPQQVYFIGCGNGPIKIGVSNNPEGRCRDMQVGSPERMVVLATVVGGIALERAYHERFGYAHMRGEWFERHPNILAEIDRLNAGGTERETETEGQNAETTE